MADPTKKTLADAFPVTGTAHGSVPGTPNVGAAAGAPGAAIPSPPPPPAKKAASSSAPATSDTGPFDLSSALTAYIQPYISGLAQAGQSGVPGLSTYLSALRSSGAPESGAIAQTLQHGLDQVSRDVAGMGPALQEQAAGAGNAGLLSDLLNAAKYQAIYKQSLYGPRPSDPSLASLWDQVVQGGSALTSNFPGTSPTSASPGSPGSANAAPSTSPVG